MESWSITLQGKRSRVLNKIWDFFKKFLNLRYFRTLFISSTIHQEGVLDIRDKQDTLTVSFSFLNQYRSEIQVHNKSAYDIYLQCLE